MESKNLDYFFYNLSGGVNLVKTRIGLGSEVKKLCWDDSFNVEPLKNQGVQSQKGNVLLLKLADEEEIVGMFEYPKGTDNFVFVTKSGKIYYYDCVLGTHTLKYSMSKPLCAVYFAHYLDGLAIVSEENEGLFFKHGASTEFQPLNAKNPDETPILATSVAVYAGRVWISSGSVLYFSALGKFDDWETPEDAGYIAKFHSSESKITALREYNGCLAVYKQDGVYLLSGSSPSEFSILRFSDIGANAHGAVVTDNNKQYFTNNDGVFALEQTGELAQIALSNNLALNIQPYFEQIDTEKTSKTLAVPCKIRNQIWFFIPFVNSRFLNIIWIYDYYLKAWFKKVIPYQITCGATVKGKIYTATSVGEIFVENVGNTFASKPIEFSFSTPFFHLGMPNTRKIIENLSFVFDEGTENCFKFSVSKDYIASTRTDIDFIDTTAANACYG